MSASVLETWLEELVPVEGLRELSDPDWRLLRDRREKPMVVVEPEPDVIEPDPHVIKELAEAQLRAAMDTLGVSELTDSLVEMVLACATAKERMWDTGAKVVQDPVAASSAQQPDDVDRSKALLGVVESVTKVSNQLDGVLLSTTRQLTASMGAMLLREKGVESPEDLTQGQRDKWRARAKSVTRHEIEAAIGWFPGEVSDLVAAANTPAQTVGTMLRSMHCGEASWRLVRRYYRECRGLDHEDAAAIANGLFGDDLDAAVTERLDSSGEWLGGPWRSREFFRALEREVARCSSRDEEAKQEARDRAKAGKDVRVDIDEIGTAAVTVGCSPMQAAAIADRIEKAARSARKAGAPETLRELRSAVATALLMHGTLERDTLPDDPDLITVEQSAQLTQILHGMPAAELNVIVPLDTLIGVDVSSGTVSGPQGPVPTTESGDPTPESFLNWAATDAASPCTCQCRCGAAEGAVRSPGSSSTGGPCPPSNGTSPPEPPGDASASSADDTSASSPGDASASSAGDASASSATETPTSAPGDRSRGSAQGGVGAVIGRHPIFLMPDEVRLLALMPGSTLYRLLTDPASGRCVERSIKAYPFDAAMRSQIVASDVFCRAPGCLRPARMSQMDHVQEHGTPGGHTCEANGQPVCEPHHDLKTKKAWDAVIDANRDVTWTTMLGRIYRTKAHDFDQYTKLLVAATTEIHVAIGDGADREDTINAAIYQALSYRDAGDTLETDDLDDEFYGWDQVTLTHTRSDGRRSYRPDPEARQAEVDRHRAAGDQGGTAAGDQGGTAADGQGGTAAGDQGGSHHDTGDATRGGRDPETPWSHDDEPPPF